MKMHGQIKLKAKQFHLAEMLFEQACYLCSRCLMKGWSQINLEWGGILLYLGTAKQEQLVTLPHLQEEIERIYKEAERRLTYGGKKGTDIPADAGLEEEEETTETKADEEELPKGYKEYNLACMAAMRGNEEECKKWLNALEEIEAYKDGHIWETWLTDPDLDMMRERQWFVSMMDRIKTKLAEATEVDADDL